MRQGQLLASGMTLKAVILNLPPTGRKPDSHPYEEVHLRGSHSISGLAFPFSTLGCTAARPAGNKGSF